MQLDPEAVLFVFIATQVSSWASSWTEYHTGMTQKNFGGLGITEYEIICILIHLITGIYGQAMWGFSLEFILPQSITASLSSLHPILQTILALKAKVAIAYLLGSLLLLSGIFRFMKTISSTNESTIKMSFEWLWLVLIIGMEFIWFKLPIYNRYCAIILINFGIITSLIVCKVIISSLTKMKLQSLQIQIIPLLITTGVLLWYNSLRSEKEMIIVLWASFALNIAMTLLFISTTISQITKYLGIKFFSLRKVPRKID